MSAFDMIIGVALLVAWLVYNFTEYRIARKHVKNLSGILSSSEQLLKLAKKGTHNENN